MTARHIAFVVPRYGTDVLGGAETLARCLAEEVIRTGLARVTVLTTCARDHLTWLNELPPGREEIRGVTVRRFPIDHESWDRDHYHDLHIRLIRREMISEDEQYEWVDCSAHSPALYSHLEEHGADYDVVILIPYLFGTTFYGAEVVPDRAVLWPCLHDEIYAYLQPTRSLFCRCQGIMFNTYPESHLARRLYGPHQGAQLVGFGLDPFDADPARFFAAHDLDGPFILYSGRLEGAKNVPLLVQHFIQYKSQRQTNLKLVLMGSGPEGLPRHPDIVPLGFCQGQAKLDTYAAATLLCQPSVNESFSIVIMESWLCHVPVLVHADCQVTRDHVTRSNGGLFFRTYEEFKAILDLLSHNPTLQTKLGENGYRYVRDVYAWDKVLERFDAAITHWQKTMPPNKPDRTSS